MPIPLETQWETPLAPSHSSLQGRRARLPPLWDPLRSLTQERSFAAHPLYCTQTTPLPRTPGSPPLSQSPKMPWLSPSLRKGGREKRKPQESSPPHLRPAACHPLPPPQLPQDSRCILPHSVPGYLAETMTASASSHRSHGSHLRPFLDNKKRPGKTIPPATNACTISLRLQGWGVGGGSTDGGRVSGAGIPPGGPLGKGSWYPRGRGGDGEGRGGWRCAGWSQAELL